MSLNFHSLIPEIQKRIKDEFIRETKTETPELLALPYPYVVPGKGIREALYYWDTFFINIGLIKMRMIDYARHNVENLIFLARKLDFVPASNHKNIATNFQPPLLPWMVRDIYRATGDKEWLRRMLPDVVKEYQYWTAKPHTTPTGLFRYYTDDKTKSETESTDNDTQLIRFNEPQNFNPVDLNALLYRNALIIYDLQVEAEGQGDNNLIKKSQQIEKLIDMCWNDKKEFYFDNDFINKKSSNHKTIAGFMPLFAEMINSDRAGVLVNQIGQFLGDGGICVAAKENNHNGSWHFPLSYAPYTYFTVKGLCDYEFMEDAADIGSNWLSMVYDIYEKTGEMWEWYNVDNKSEKLPNNIPNNPVLGGTAGTYIALLNTLGLE